MKESMSTHFQMTPYDPYGNLGDGKSNRRFRTVGINRTSQTAILYKFVQIVLMIQQGFNGSLMGQCLLRRPFLSLRKWKQLQRTLPTLQRRFQRIPSTGQAD